MDSLYVDFGHGSSIDSVESYLGVNELMYLNDLFFWVVPWRESSYPQPYCFHFTDVLHPSSSPGTRLPTFHRIQFLLARPEQMVFATVLSWKA